MFLGERQREVAGGVDRELLYRKVLRGGDGCLKGRKVLWGGMEWLEWLYLYWKRRGGIRPAEGGGRGSGA